MELYEIQENLRYLGLYTGAIDNTVGPLTKNATGKFQTEFKGLYTGKIDGTPGPLTQAALSKAFAAATIEIMLSAFEDIDADDLFKGNVKITKECYTITQSGHWKFNDLSANSNIFINTMCFQ